MFKTARDFFQGHAIQRFVCILHGQCSYIAAPHMRLQPSHGTRTSKRIESMRAHTRAQTV